MVRKRSTEKEEGRNEKRRTSELKTKSGRTETLLNRVPVSIDDGIRDLIDGILRDLIAIECDVELVWDTRRFRKTFLPNVSMFSAPMIRMRGKTDAMV